MAAGREPTGHSEGDEPRVYYHGTVRLEDDPGWTHIEPNHGANFAESEPGFVYATISRWAAKSYAEKVHDLQAWSWSRPIVYEVRPTGPVETDPAYRGEFSRGNFTDDVRSRYPFELVAEHELPGDWHCEYCGSVDHSNADHAHDLQWEAHARPELAQVGPETAMAYPTLNRRQEGDAGLEL
jgi:Rifampin ADP-ribosyl transferase